MDVRPVQCTLSEMMAANLRLRWLRIGHIPLCAVIVWYLASIRRPAKPAAPTPSGPGTQWLWSNRYVRVERWHSPFIVTGSYSGTGESSTDQKILASGNGFRATSLPGLTLRVHQFNFWQLNLIPSAFAALTLTALLALGEWILHRRHARAAGLCRICGYDLRATPDRCPECGAVPAPAKDARVPKPGG